MSQVTQGVREAERAMKGVFQGRKTRIEPIRAYFFLKSAPQCEMQ
jgi:hypothetical protein